MLHVEVEDTGCGVPLEQRARVFEKLYQIVGFDHADTSQAGRIGLGLGLHIARDLVRRQGGNIWITGDPERGSIFNFTLPLAAGNAQADSTGQGTPRRRKTDLPESLAVQMNPAA
jgi:signal transduction histidine kinase